MAHQYCQRVIQKLANTVQFQVEINYANGTNLGKVFSIDIANRSMEAAFSRSKVVIDGDALNNIALAYALTIHKSQVGQFIHVIMPMSTSHFVILNCKLTYTGITRAKHSVHLIGTEKALKKAVNTEENVARQTLLHEQLIKWTAKGERTMKTPLVLCLALLTASLSGCFWNNKPKLSKQVATGKQIYDLKLIQRNHPLKHGFTQPKPGEPHSKENLIAGISLAKFNSLCGY